jgi:UDP-glucose 6-dehydrogenase
VVYPKDVSRITGKSERYDRKLLKTIKETNEKENHQFVSLEEFSDYTGLTVELIKEHLID